MTQRNDASRGDSVLAVDPSRSTPEQSAVPSTLSAQGDAAGPTRADDLAGTLASLTDTLLRLRSSIEREDAANRATIAALRTALADAERERDALAGLFGGMARELGLTAPHDEPANVYESVEALTAAVADAEGDAAAWKAFRALMVLPGVSWSVAHPRDDSDVLHVGFTFPMAREQAVAAVESGGLGWAPTLENMLRNAAAALAPSSSAPAPEIGDLTDAR